MPLYWSYPAALFGTSTMDSQGSSCRQSRNCSGGGSRAPPSPDKGYFEAWHDGEEDTDSSAQALPAQ